MCGFELLGTDSILEQGVKFSWRPIFRFSQGEIRPHQGQKAKTTPDETTLSSQVPCGRVQDRWVEFVGNDTGNVTLHQVRRGFSHVLGGSILLHFRSSSLGARAKLTASPLKNSWH